MGTALHRLRAPAASTFCRLRDRFRARKVVNTKNRPLLMHNLFQTLKSFDIGNGKEGQFYSLPALEEAGVGNISRLPVSIRVVLESVLRNCDGKKVTEKNVRELAGWKPQAERVEEIPLIVA